MFLSRTQIASWLYRCGEIFTTENDFFTGLDREIDDTGHDLNTHRGFSKVVEELLSITDKDIGLILKDTDVVLPSSVGGASGPLLGTFFVRTAQVTQAHQGLTPEELYQMMRDGAEDVISRGRTEPDGRTMCDVQLPVVGSSCQFCEQKSGIQAALEAASQQAETVAQDTITMRTRKGRANYLDERSIGHQDPGATSVMFIIQMLAQASRE